MPTATRRTAKSQNDTDVETQNVETEVTETPETVTEETQSETETSGEIEQPVNRIPDALNIPVLSEFCQRYLDVLDEIAEYNKLVLAEKDSPWTAAKVLEKARELGRPANKDDADTDILTAIEEWERLVTAVNAARKAVMDKTADKLGIQLSAVADRNPETEGPLKEKRKVAVEIGSQLSTIAKMTNDTRTSGAVTEFLASNPLPAVGRDQVRSFSDGSTSTPKYRVEIEVSKNGEVLLSEKGFTKTALALTKPAFGYERGKAPKPDDFRKAWEAAGNSSDATPNPTVEFESNGLHFKITKS